MFRLIRTDETLTRMLSTFDLIGEEKDLLCTTDKSRSTGDLKFNIVYIPVPPVLHDWSVDKKNTFLLTYTDVC